MKYKILGVVLALGALGYLFREKVVDLVNDVLDKVDAMVEDPTTDDELDYDPTEAAPDLPKNAEGYGIPGSRAYPREQG